MIFHINELVNLKGYFSLFFEHIFFYYSILIFYTWPQGYRGFVVHEVQIFVDLYAYTCIHTYLHTHTHIHI